MLQAALALTPVETEDVGKALVDARLERVVAFGLDQSRLAERERRMPPLRNPCRQGETHEHGRPRGAWGSSVSGLLEQGDRAAAVTHPLEPVGGKDDAAAPDLRVRVRSEPHCLLGEV